MQDFSQNTPNINPMPPPGMSGGMPKAAPPPVKKDPWETVDVRNNKFFRNKELLGSRQSVVSGFRKDLAGTLSKFSQKNLIAKDLAKAGARGYLSKKKIKDVLRKEYEAGNINKRQMRRVTRKYGAI